MRLRSFFTFDGANYNPSRQPAEGWSADDWNGSHYLQGAWKPRVGLARLAGLATAGSAVLVIADHRGFTEGLQVIAIQANGEANAVATPEPGWTA